MNHSGLGDRPLFVIPTAIERKLFFDAWQKLRQESFPQPLELCGFGPIAAAASLAPLLHQHRPSAVVLLGIAGGFSCETEPELASEKQTPLVRSQAIEFSQVATDCVGAEADAVGVWELPSEMGIPQWEVAAGRGDTMGGSETGPVFERLPLATFSQPSPALLLTVGIASGCRQTAERRRARFPGVVAEDMEGFGVALACKIAGVPLAIVRGISNSVGQRDKRTWQIDAAIAAVSRHIAEHLLQK